MTTHDQATGSVPMITKAMLQGACKGQRAVFKAEWPGGAEATLENVMRAVELGLSLEWGERLFTRSARAEYETKSAPLRDEYAANITTLWAEYEAQRETLWDEYAANITTLLAEYAAQRKTLLAEYEAQRKTLWAECEAQSETLWAECGAKRARLQAEFRASLVPFWLAAFLASHDGGGK